MTAWCDAVQTDLHLTCTLPAGHDGRHEAWTCTCDHGRCDDPWACTARWKP